MALNTFRSNYLMPLRFKGLILDMFPIVTKCVTFHILGMNLD